MADNKDKSTVDTQDEGLTREQKAVALGVTLQGLDALERQVSSGRLPTQAAPVAPPVAPPMTGTQPAPISPVAPPPMLINRGGQQYPGTPAPAPTGQGRMYMGPASGEGALMQSAPGTRMNLMPPPAPVPPQSQAAMRARLAAGTGAESDPAALSRLQAADQPGSRTIAVRSEPQYSDASLANQRNAMLYNAMKKFDAGDRSPEVMAAAMGSAAPKAMTPYQQAQVERWNKPSTITPYQQAEIERWKRQDLKPETQTVTEHIPRKEGVAGTPAQPARKGYLGIGARAAVPAVPEVPTQEARTISRKVPVEAPAAAPKSKSAPSVGEVRNGWRFKGGDPSKKSNWEQL